MAKSVSGKKALILGLQTSWLIVLRLAGFIMAKLLIPRLFRLET